MGDRVNYSGLVIAGIGFFLTRFTVTLAIYDDPIRFYFAGFIPLILGLGLAAFGVALAVADVDPSVSRTTATWCVIGSVAMAVLVGLTLLGSTAGDPNSFTAVRSQAYLSNFLIGGSIGGTLTGLYASRTRRQRGALKAQANRLEVLNRLLRHEVINAVAAIQGWISQIGTDDERVVEVISTKSESIEQTIEQVKYLTSATDKPVLLTAEVNLKETLEAAVTAVEDRHSDVTVTVESCPEDLKVRATERLELVFAHLLENAIEHGRDLSPELVIEATERQVRVSVMDAGPGLPESQRALLEDGVIQEFDDPETGFGLNVARLLVEDFHGTFETKTTSDGSRVTVILDRAIVDPTAQRPLPAGVSEVKPSIPHLLVTTVAALIAGLFYGIVSESLGGSIAGIGVFYGIQNPAVGWFTHEFHSVVFAFVFAGIVSVAPLRYRTNPWAFLTIGLGWSAILWIVAAGVIAPVWLRLLGIPVSIPSFAGSLLVSHLVWGASLGILTAFGYRWVVPWMDRIGRRNRGISRLVS